MEIPIRDWTFTHWWVRPVVKVWFDFYHKSVTYSGFEQVNWSKPIIFAPSHQSAFTDALCLILPTEYTNDRFIYPLIRADAFGNNSFIDWVLTAFHMLPVYRPKDNVDLRKRNNLVFFDCYKILSKNRNLLIHPEGNCYAIKRVRQFKKGLARIAFGAEENNDFNLGVTIVPVGINYRTVTQERGGIHIQCGNPIDVSEYKEAYAEHSASAISDLTQSVEQGVKKVTVDIQSDEYYTLTEDILDLAKNRSASFVSDLQYTREEVIFEKQLIQTVDQVIEDSESAQELQTAVQNILENLKGLKLSKKLPLVQTHKPLLLVGEGLSYVFLIPLYLYGWINNILPWYLIHNLADRIKDKQFINSARMASGLLIFPICYLVQSAIFGLIYGSITWTLVYLLSLPISGILSLNIWEQWKHWRQQWRLYRMSKDQRDELDRMLEEVFTKFEGEKTE